MTIIASVIQMPKSVIRRRIRRMCFEAHVTAKYNSGRMRLATAAKEFAVR
jgi:hypothetical protein